MRTNQRTVDPALLKEVQRLLEERFTVEIHVHSAVYLTDPKRRNAVLRIKLQSSSDAVPTSVILKQSLPMKVDPQKADARKIEEENAETFARFSRDWAGLEFVSDISQDAHIVPRFYGGSREHCFILLEDLGQKHVSLVDTLTTTNSEKAILALERYMKALGSLHAVGFKHTKLYVAALKNVNPKAETAQTELVDTSKNLSEKLAKVFKIEKLGLSKPKGFADEVQQVLKGIFEPGPFTVLTHGDIAPDNVFDHQNAKDLQLIDFEWCGVRNALLDGTFLRMSIPTGWCAKTIPNDIIQHVEQIYRNELIKTISSASDDAIYNTAYTQACAFHALHSMAAIESCLEKDQIWGSGPVPKDSSWDQDNNLFRPRLITRLQTFINIATEHNMYPDIRKAAVDMLERVKILWPGAKPMDEYPAFKSERALAEFATKKSIQTLMKRKKIPAMSVATITNGETSVYALGVDENTKSGTPITDKTIFEAASLSKPIFAYLIFQLVKEKRLPVDFLDKPLWEILPTYQPPFRKPSESNKEAEPIRFDDSKKGQSITASHVLSHRTGMVNWINDNNEHKFNESEKFGYSGDGYHYLQKVVEKLTGESLEALAKKYVFGSDALKMNDTKFSCPTPEENKHLAVGHDKDMVAKHSSRRPDQNAAYSLHTNAADYIRFLQACLNEKDPLFEKFLKAAVTITDDKLVAWNLGWCIEKSDKGPILLHWGDNVNMKAFAALNRKTGSAIVYFANSFNGMDIAEEMVKLGAPKVGVPTFSLDFLSKEYKYERPELLNTSKVYERLKQIPTIDADKKKTENKIDTNAEATSSDRKTVAEMAKNYEKSLPEHATTAKSIHKVPTFKPRGSKE